MATTAHSPTHLKRSLSLGAAVLLGLGSMVGTGVFVSLGLGAGLVGPGVLLAIVLAGLLALCNGLSSAQLAAVFPVAGGTYEYGHRVGWPALGAVAGSTFLVAKSASAATAALGLAGYVLQRFDATHLMMPGALAVIVMLAVVVLEGIRRTNHANAVIVGITFLGLIIFVVAGSGSVDLANLTASWTASGQATAASDVWWRDLPHAAALMFVAYTGYGRIATLGEEVADPRRTIPRAIVVTTLICVIVYVAVAAVAVGTVGAQAFFNLSVGGAPLEAISRQLGLPGLVAWLITLAAITAMAGVVLNLLLGLSRVVLAMGRRGHLPQRFAKLDATGSTPSAAVLLVTGIVLVLAAVGSIKAAWSLSAVTVLIYYAITNAAALRLPAEHRFYARAWSWAGLLGCLGLSVFVEGRFWIVAATVVGATLLWHRFAPQRDPVTPPA